MNRSYAAKLANHSLRCNHQKVPHSLSRKAGGDLGDRYYVALIPSPQGEGAGGEVMIS